MENLLQSIVMILLVVIAWHDHKTMEIPDEYNIALAVCGAVSMFLWKEISLIDRLIGACCISIPMYLVICLIPGAFGGGDVKLTFAIGLYLGWKMTLTGTFLAFLIGGMQAIYLLATGKAKSGEGAHMAFGPALCAGCILAIIWGNRILGWYLGLFY